MTTSELNELKLRWNQLQALVRKYGVRAIASIPNEQWEQLILRDVPTLLEELERRPPLPNRDWMIASPSINL